MPELTLHCPMCRAEIDAGSIAGACASCPLYHVKSGCCIDLIACPRCGYHSLPQEHVGGPAPRTRPESLPSVNPTTDLPSFSPAVCAGALRMTEVTPGTKARVLGFSDVDDNQIGRLTAYGLLPGVTIEVVQRFPAIILSVYQAELAIETGLAQGIWVLPSGEARNGDPEPADALTRTRAIDRIRRMFRKG